MQIGRAIRPTAKGTPGSRLSLRFSQIPTHDEGKLYMFESFEDVFFAVTALAGLPANTLVVALLLFRPLIAPDLWLS